MDNIDWSDPQYFELIKEYPEDANWVVICQCEWALPLLDTNLDKIYWEILATHEWAYPFVMKYIHCNEESNRCSWVALSQAEWAVQLLLKHPENIVWDLALMNPHASLLFETHIDKVNWDCIYETPQWLINIIESNFDKVDWHAIHTNCLNVKYPYATLKKRNETIDRELVEYLFHPSKIWKWINEGNSIDEYMS